MPIPKPASCVGCPLYGTGEGFSRPEGTCANGVLVVGEALGRHEAADGLPFRPHADAGSVLEQVFRLTGTDRQQVGIWNVCGCQPPSNVLEGAPYEFAAIQHCQHHLDAVVERFKPKVLIALGAIPLRALTGLVGEKLSITHVRGYILHSDRYGLPVVASYHPSYIRRGAPHLMGVLIRDFRTALRTARQGVPAVERHYVEYPTEAQAWEFLERVRATSQGTLSYDTETRDVVGAEEEDIEWAASKEITLIQFSLGVGDGIAFPNVEPYTEVARQILQVPMRRIGYNTHEYDDPIMRANGFQLVGHTEDLRWKFHHLYPDIPGKSHKGGLQWVGAFYCPEFGPWKHLFGAQLEWYGCADVDMPHRIDQGLTREMREIGVWDSYQKFVVRLRPVLDRMSARGVALDHEGREKFREEVLGIQRQAFEEMQGMVPDELKNCVPKEGYKNDKIAEKARLKPLAEGEKWARRIFAVPASSTGGDNVGGMLGGTGATNGASGGAGVGASVERWCRLQPFKPSSQQLMAYMRSRGHKVPKIPGEDKETAGKLGIQRLHAKTRDPLYAKVLEFREAQKIASTYIDGWECGSDGRVHTTFTFRPATGQLSCVAHWTPVKTSRGTVPIDEVRVGDLVWTHRLRWRRVTHTWIKGLEAMFDVTFSNGETLTCTGAHCVLTCVHEHIEALDRRSTERAEGVDVVSQLGRTDSAYDSASVGGYGPYRRVGHSASRAESGDESVASSALLTVKDWRQKSNEGQDGGEPPQLDWSCGRWVRVSDLLAGREAIFRSSDCYDGCVGVVGTAQGNDGTSCGWGPKEQQSRQLSVSNECCASTNPCAPVAGYCVYHVEEILPVGSFTVYDITVDEDESYETCGVFSHNSKSPNIQNIPRRVGLARAFRRMIVASPGHRLVSLDYRSFHALTLGFEAKDPDYMRMARIDLHSFIAATQILRVEKADTLMALPDDDLRARLKWWRSNTERTWPTSDGPKAFKWVRDFRAKPCIAEGQLVLTDKGLIPIENVSIDERVWDGVEWVRHQGVVCQGEKEVITYDGLTATPDHQVVLQSGRVCTLRSAASNVARLERTGTERQAVRTIHRDLLEATARERLHSGQGAMPMWQGDVARLEQPREGTDDRMYLLPKRQALLTTRACVGSALRRDNFSVQQPQESSVPSLWWARNSVPVQVAPGVCDLGVEPLATSRLSGGGDRPNRQQRELRAGERTFGYPAPTTVKHPIQCVDDISGQANPATRFPESLHRVMDEAFSEDGLDGRTNNRRREGVYPAKEQTLAQAAGPARTTRVYDIINAGPRFCYTVSGKLVLNCILGYGFGLGGKHLYEQNTESFDSQAQAQQALNSIDVAFPRTKRFREDIRKVAQQRKHLMSRHGCVRWFWAVMTWDAKTRTWKSGPDAQKAIAFLPANDAFCHIKGAMLALEDAGMNERYGLIDQIHDDLTFDCPEGLVEECLTNVRREMEHPSDVLIDPVVAPGGLWCGVDAKVGRNLGEMEDV